MDPLKELTKILFQIDPMKLKSLNKEEYSSEAEEIVKELPYVTSPERMQNVLMHVFSKGFSKKEASIDWKPTLSAIYSSKLLGPILTKSKTKAKSK